MKQKLIIVGAGGHGRVVADLAERLGCYGSILFLDDGGPIGGNVVGGVSACKTYLADSDFFIAIGDNATRERLFAELDALGASIATLVHPFACVSPHATLGGGSIVMAGAVIQSGATLGRGIIVNTGATVDHDCRLADFCHVAVGAHLAGTVTVGERTVVGAGAMIVNNVNIPADSIIGAGAVVVKNISERGTYVGVPARRLHADPDSRQ
ncbi:MAG: acetyltransferase [Clostridia bacterium]|nr:acetyltransferase [Clostridia bacterium]